MSRLALFALLLANAACPERTTPERGVALTWKKPAFATDLRATVDRRLAQLGVKASLQEDRTTLTVRVPEGGDVAEVKALLERRARLQFCAPDEPLAARWCDGPPPPGLEVTRDGERCRLTAATRAAVAAAFADAGVTLAVGPTPHGVEAWPVDGACLEPHLVSATAAPAPGATTQALSVQLDRAGTADFAALTTRLRGHHLLLVLDDELLLAPLVQDAITGGKAMLLVHEPAGRLRLLAAALAGGPLPALELVSEKPYGPPSLR